MNHARTAGTIVLPGGAGYLGRVLIEHFTRQSYNIVILTRLPHRTDEASHPAVRRVFWDGASLGAWTQALEGARAVINLAGRTVNCRYNASNKREIYASRLLSTQALGTALAACQNPPPVWINSSSATIYRHAEDRPMDEATGEIGHGFSVDVCLKWESALNLATLPHTRRVALRSAMVFGPGKGGVLEAFERIVRRGLGGTLGRGNQFVSWVHATDFARAVQWIMEHETLIGPVNCASSNPVPNAEFMRTFREVCQQPIGLPATAWMLEIGALFLGTETELLLKSRRVVPGKLLADGFTFQFPEWREALEETIHHKGTKGARRE